MGRLHPIEGSGGLTEDVFDASQPVFEGRQFDRHLIFAAAVAAQKPGAADDGTGEGKAAANYQERKEVHGVLT